MSNINVVIEIILGLLIPIVFCLLSVLFPPEWYKETKHQWKNINITSMMISITTTLLFIGYIHFFKRNDMFLIAVIVSFASITYSFIQSLFTDFNLRLVDGRLQYLVIFLTGIVNYFIVKSLPGGNDMVNMMIIFSIAGLALNLLMPPSVLGAADFRAFVILSTTILPLFGYQYLTHCIVVFLFLAILYSLIKTYQLKEKDKKILIYFMTKTSIPAVPLIIGPAVFVIIYSVA